MLQFYFLAIFVNLIGGIYFANDFLAKKFPRATKVAEFFENGTSKMIFAIVAGITGLFLIISVTPGDVAVVGDLLIAITSIIICLYFLKDTITKNVKPAEEVPVPDAAAEVTPDAEKPADEAAAPEPAAEAPKAAKKKCDFGKACGSFYSVIDKFKTAIGILAIALAVLHFCFPAVVLI